MLEMIRLDPITLRPKTSETELFSYPKCFNHWAHSLLSYPVAVLLSERARDHLNVVLGRNLS